MPVMILGQGYSIKLWSSTWYLPTLFLLIIATIDGYFFMNWKLFSLLESENWYELTDFLEEQVLQKGRYRTSYVRTLIQTYFVTGKVKSIDPLEQVLRDNRPVLLKKFALELGMPKVLHKDHADMARFFGEFKSQRVPHRQWIHFLYAFGSLMQQEHSEGREELLSLLREVRDPILKVLVLYTLDPFRTLDNEVLEQVDMQKKAMRDRFTRARLENELNAHKENVAMVVMAPLIKDASDWLFSEQTK